MANIRKSSPSFVEEVRNELQGTLPSGNNSSIGSDLVGWNGFKKILDEGVAGGRLFTNDIVTTYSLAYTTSIAAYFGGILAPNGDIHFVPNSANRGQKISAAGVVSTYDLVYTVSFAYGGGVLAPNGDIHFIPYNANRGQKIDINGTVSTYSLVYTASAAYSGGVLLPNGDIHFVPDTANRGQKISANGTVSTYSLIYTTTSAYNGGVLAPDGSIYFVPYSAAVGQEISTMTSPFSQGICMSPWFNKF
jgi:hypothetical protein